MAARQDTRDHTEKIIMESLLFVGKGHRKGLRFPAGEFANIPPSCPVDDGTEGVEAFERPNQRDPRGIVNVRAAQVVESRLEGGRFAQE